MQMILVLAGGFGTDHPPFTKRTPGLEAIPRIKSPQKLIMLA